MIPFPSKSAKRGSKSKRINSTHRDGKLEGVNGSRRTDAGQRPTPCISENRDRVSNSLYALKGLGKRSPT